MPDPAVPNAIVVGGGIAGLSATLALRQSGIEAVAYERASALREVGAGITLWPNATDVLRHLGVLSTVEANAGRIDTVSVRDSNGQTLLRFRIRGHDAPALCAHRAELLDALRAALPAKAVRLGKALENIHEHSSRVRAQFADGTEVATPLVVGADGIRSTVRALLLHDGSPRYAGRSVWRAVAPTPSSFEPSSSVETWGDGIRFGLIDAGADRVYWYAVQKRLPGEVRDQPAKAKAALLAALRGWPASVLSAVESTPAEAILRDDVYDRPPSRPWHRGRVVMIGDAVHPMTPDLGQGGCMAVEDAAALARTLSGNQELERALEAFVGGRYARTAWVTRQSRLAGRIGQAGGAAAQIRNFAARFYPSPVFRSLFTWPFRYAA